MAALLKRYPLAHVERYAGVRVAGTLEEAGRFADSGLHADDLAARDSGDLKERRKDA
jgi:predicted RNA-binding protein (virulence factor B family)